MAIKVPGGSQLPRSLILVVARSLRSSRRSWHSRSLRCARGARYTRHSRHCWPCRKSSAALRAYLFGCARFRATFRTGLVDLNCSRSEAHNLYPFCRQCNCLQKYSPGKELRPHSRNLKIARDSKPKRLISRIQTALRFVHSLKMSKSPRDSRARCSKKIRALEHSSSARSRVLKTIKSGGRADDEQMHGRLATPEKYG